MSLLTRLITATLVSGLASIVHAQPDSLSQPGLKRNVPLSEQRDVLDVARKLLPFLHLKSEAVRLPCLSAVRLSGYFPKEAIPYKPGFWSKFRATSRIDDLVLMCRR